MDERVVEKIRKLLKLAGSHNEHEARLAAEMANDLLLRHNLSMQQVAAATAEGIKEKGQYTAWFVRVEDKWLCPLIAEHFFVEVIQFRRHRGYNAANQRVYDSTLTFIGTDTNVEVASFTYDFLYRQYRSLWLAYKQASGKSEKARQAYYLGLTHGLGTQLAARRQKVQTETGLVVVPNPGLVAHMATIDRKKAHPGRNASDDNEAALSGIRDGESLSIAQGLKPGDDRKNVGGPVLRLRGKD